MRLIHIHYNENGVCAGRGGFASVGEGADDRMRCFAGGWVILKEGDGVWRVNQSMVDWPI